MSPTVLYGWLVLRAWSRRRGHTLALFGGAALLALLALSGVVNIYLGVHWPADVIGGYLWGAAIVALASGLMRRVCP
jgi:undecaprenyl-diphosphatase